MNIQEASNEDLNVKNIKNEYKNDLANNYKFSEDLLNPDIEEHISIESDIEGILYYLKKLNFYLFNL
jgi:hypothetical protein